MGWSTFRKTGLTHVDASRAMRGYTLITPQHGESTLLLDVEGRVVHRWHAPGFHLIYGRLLPSGNLLVLATDDSMQSQPIRVGVTPTFSENIRRLGGYSSHLLELDWEGNVLWQFSNQALHHDFYRLPNGNTLMPVWIELPQSLEKAVRAGVKVPPDSPPMLSDDIIEIDPAGREVSRVSIWKMLDPEEDPSCPIELVQGREWTHTNGIDVDSDGNLLFSCRVNSRVGLIDRKSQRLLWKFGRLTTSHQHHPTALANGNVQLFDNGSHIQGPDRSRVIEVDPATRKIVWQYTGDPEQSFYSYNISGAERLESGNVLICEGASGRIFEVTRAGETVWEWVTPFEVLGARPSKLSIFRAHRYLDDHPALVGHDLDPARHRDLNLKYGLIE